MTKSNNEANSLIKKKIAALQKKRNELLTDKFEAVSSNIFANLAEETMMRKMDRTMKKLESDIQGSGIISQIPFNSYLPISVEKNYLKPAAFSSITTLELIENLTRIDQYKTPLIQDMFNVSGDFIDFIPDRYFHPSVGLSQEIQNPENLSSDESLQQSPLLPQVPPKTFSEDEIKKIRFEFELIINGRKKIQENHYSIISVMLETHIYLDLLFDQYQNTDYIYSKREIEKLLYRYNNFDPYLCMKDEEDQLFNLKTIFKAILRKIKFEPKIWKGNNTAQGGNISNQEDTDSSSEKGAQKIPKWGVNFLSIKKRNDIENAEEYIIKKSSLLNRSPKKAFVHAISSIEENPDPKGKVSPKINYPSLTIPESLKELDLYALDNPRDNISKIETLFNLLADNSLEILNQVKEIGININYNIYTNTFEEINPYNSENLKRMSGIRDQLNHYIDKEFSELSLAEPIFLIEDTYKMSSFLGEYHSGQIIHTMTLSPKTQREVRIKSTEISKTKRKQNASIFESVGQEQKQSFENQVENERNQSQGIDQSFSQYQDAKTAASQGRELGKEDTRRAQDKTSLGESSKQHGELGYEGGFIAKIAGSVNASGSIDSEKNSRQDKEREQKSTLTQKQTLNLTNELNQGASTSLNSNREESARIMESALASHSQEVSAKRDTTVNEASEEELEKVEEKGATQIYKNDNASKAMNLFFAEIMQDYLTFTHLVDVRICFSNGTIWDSTPISKLDSFLQKYLKPRTSENDPDYYRILIDLCKMSTRVIDYKNRVINLIDEKNFRIQQKKYGEFLMELDNKEIALDDVNNYLYFHQLNGIVLSTTINQIKQNGLEMKVLLTDNALDAYAEQAINNQLKIEREEGRRVELLNEGIQSNIKFVDTISKTPATVEKLLPQNIEARFKLLTNSKNILINTYLANLISSGKSGSLEDKLKQFDVNI